MTQGKSALAMVAMLFAAAHFPARAQAAPDMVLSGHCQYPDRVLRFQSQTALLPCDTLTIRRDGQGATLDFSRRSWGTAIRLTGDMPGDRMSIGSLSLRDGAPVAATGTCEIFYANGNVSVVSCLAKAGSRSYATNFVPSHF